MAVLKKAGVWGLRFQIKHKHVVSTEHLLLSTFPLGGWMLGVRQECLQDEHLRKTPGAASHTLPWWMTFHMHCCHLSPGVSCLTPQRETSPKLTASVPFADFSFVSFSIRDLSPV